ncbi:MAG: DsrE family protein [Spirochaetes bacterium]|nr:DsrE family protein [Spirochaetota bacterium]
MSAEKKITYIVTYGEDNPEKATIPFILANGAMAMDVTPVIVLQSNAVMLAVKGFAEKVHFKEGVSLKQLIENYTGAGYQILLCSPCVEKRKLTEKDFIEGAIVVGAARVTEEVLSSVNVLTY